jgi:hypothetical protein
MDGGFAGDSNCVSWAEVPGERIAEIPPRQPARAPIQRGSGQREIAKGETHG